MSDLNIDTAISNGSVSFWSWNNDISIEEVKHQLSEFADGRLSGVIIHARAGLTIPYMGNEWFKAFQTAAEEAKRLGLEIWIYDEDGWPSGFAGGKIPALGKDYCLKRLFYCFGKEKMPKEIKSEQIVAAYNLCGENQYCRIPTDQAKENDLFFWYEICEQYVDLLKPETVKLFIHYVHDVYKQKLGQYFGNTIKGVFTDEPQLNSMGYPWSNSLLEAYEKEYEESLLDKMWLVAVDGEDYRTFRLHLWRTISRQYRDSFVIQLSNWCEENHLYLTGHFPAEDGLCDQLSSCGEVMPYYKYMQLPGIDHLGSRVASPVLMKQASSVSRQFRDGNVLSETFGCSGWGISFKQMAWIWGGQSVLGITKPCYHLSAYSIEGVRKRDYPAFYSYQEPWWNEFKQISLWIDNLNQLMTEGKREVDTLLIPPMAAVMMEYKDIFHNRNQMCKYSQEYRVLLENLLDLQVDVDLGDEQLLIGNAILVDGKLKLGNCEYKTIFIAECSFIEQKIADLIDRFAKQGGKVIFVNSRPSILDKSATCDLSLTPAYDICNRRDTIEKLLQHIGGFRKFELCRTEDLRLENGFRLHVRNLGDRHRIHIWSNASSTKRDVVLSVEGQVSIYKVNLVTDARELLESVNGMGNRTYANLVINEKENVILETEPFVLLKSKRKLISTKEQQTVDIHICDKNCLTIDRAVYSINGSAFSEELPIIRISDLLYKDKNIGEKSIILQYRFYCNESVPANDFTLGVEDKQCKDILVNGISVKGNRLNWWIDKCIGEYAIGSLVQNGENVISVFCQIPSIEMKHDLNEVFETEKNRFYYPVEPESVYIRGNFDVEPFEKELNGIFRYSVTNNGFKIKPFTPKKMGDITHQGMWFYRGDVTYTFSVMMVNTQERISIDTGRYYGTMIECTVNGKSILSFDNPCDIDISEHLKIGENNISIRLIGNNRNLLGPHHHINGENFLIGPGTFKGERSSLEEFMSPWIQGDNTWTDNYGFIPFGLQNIVIKYYQEDFLV